MLQIVQITGVFWHKNSTSESIYLAVKPIISLLFATKRYLSSQKIEHELLLPPDIVQRDLFITALDPKLHSIFGPTNLRRYAACGLSHSQTK